MPSKTLRRATILATESDPVSNFATSLLRVVQNCLGKPSTPLADPQQGVACHASLGVENLTKAYTRARTCVRMQDDVTVTSEQSLQRIM